MITKTIHLSVCIANNWGTRIHNKKTYMYSKLSYSINHCTQTCWSVVLRCNNYLYITINYRANFLFRLLTPLPTHPMSIFSNTLIDHSHQITSLTHQISTTWAFIVFKYELICQYQQISAASLVREIGLPCHHGNPQCIFFELEALKRIDTYTNTKNISKLQEREKKKRRAGNRKERKTLSCAAEVNIVDITWMGLTSTLNGCNGATPRPKTQDCCAESVPL